MLNLELSFISPKSDCVRGPMVLVLLACVKLDDVEVAFVVFCCPVACVKLDDVVF